MCHRDSIQYDLCRLCVNRKEMLWIFIFKRVTFLLSMTFQDRIMTIQFGNTGGRYANWPRFCIQHLDRKYMPLDRKYTPLYSKHTLSLF